ncbi:MAG: sn-glycerol-1-phosphate dehydrogenase [Ruminococcaceae bacterium]|nr:sn-glycerol-1-phosphate dehydrogenase [Oscillospiraceae bacterium]
MELSELLLGRKDCPCGMSHSCPIDYLVIEEGALKKIPELVANYSSIVLAADTNTYAVCGKQVEELIKDKIESVLVYESEGVLVPNEAAIALLTDKVTEKTDLIVGVGSGVINDLCKQVSFASKLPYYIVATAPSMDGYASKGSALILDGMKVTLNADVPKAIIADINIIKNAPFEMIQAGYGDIIGKFSCLNDWKLSSVVNGEYICDYVFNATMDTTKETVFLADKLTERDPHAVSALMKALVTVGILMAYVGNSRPASGSEHHMSHYFEIVGILRGEPYFSHGIDVCYSAVETCRIREELLKIENIEEFNDCFDADEYNANINRIYGSIAGEVFALQNKMGWYDLDRVAIYKEKWAEIRKVLAEAPTSAEMLDYVKRVGLDYNDFTKLYGEEKIADGKLYAKDLKDRYSVLWMLYELYGAKAKSI